MPQLKAYYLPDADGSNHFLVAAPNQKEACRLMRVSPGYFRKYGGRRVGGMTADVALSEPGKLWKQNNRCGEVHPWTLEAHR